MNEFAEFHAELRAQARDVLGRFGSGATGDSAPADATGPAPVPWAAVVRAGWPGLAAPTEFDGAGATFAETAVLLEEIGRAAAVTPLPTVLALSVPALTAVAADPDRDRLLRDTVAGQVVPTVVLDAGSVLGTAGLSPRTGTAGTQLDDQLRERAGSSVGLGAGAAGVRLTGASGGSSAGCSFGLEAGAAGVRSAGAAGGSFGSSFVLESGSAGPRLTGAARFVLDAAGADLLLVPARDDQGMPLLAAVDPAVPGLTITATPLVDATRSVASVTAEAVAVQAVWQVADPGLWSTLRARAAVAIACDSLGSAEAMLEATVAYVQVREQFGRPVGSFQAVKHACADMLVQTTVARHLVAAAVRAIAEGTDDMLLAAAQAKSYSTTAAVRVAGAAMQLHGGIGYTWDSGIHVHLKRATLNRALFGAPAEHRKTLVARYPERPAR